MAYLANPTLDFSSHSDAGSGSSALLSGIRADYHVVDEHLIFGSRSWTMRKVENTNRLLDAIDPKVFAADERLPYWAELWPSSIELARFCLDEARVRNGTVLELGCGLGLAGIAAAAAGAHVVLTDYEPDALLFARFNAGTNLSPEVVRSGIEFRLLDWRSPGQVDPVGVIIGADVMYERVQFLPLLSFVRRFLKTDGYAVFTDPDRSTGMSFFALAERQGFEVTLQSRVLRYRGRENAIVLGILRPPR